MKKKAIPLLRKLGFRMTGKGFEYILKALELIAEGSASAREACDLYRQIGEIFNTSPQNVERPIRYEISTVSENPLFKELFPVRPTVSEFIAVLSFELEGE